MNTCIFTGRPTKDPEIRYVGEENKACATFYLAVSRGRKNQAGEKQTDFHTCVCWGKTAENVAQYVHKGDLILCVGQAQNRSWEGTDGTKHRVTEFSLSAVEFLNTKRVEAAPQQQAQQRKPQHKDPEPDWFNYDGPMPWD